MTKKLEELFNLPPQDGTPDPTVDESTSFVNENRELITEVDLAIDKIDAALPTVRDLETGDNELDELAKKATEAYDDIMDLGMNVEARYSARMFEVAASMLKNAIDAKTAKLDKKLKMIDLQLKKQKIDQDANGADDSVTLQGDGVIITDRNSLLEKLKQMK